MGSYDERLNLGLDQQRAYVPPQAQGPPQRRQEKDGSVSSSAQKPIDGTVNQAFDKAAQSSGLPSDVISQIAEQVRAQVIDSLKAEGLAYPVSNEPVSSDSTWQREFDPNPHPERGSIRQASCNDTIPPRRETSQSMKEDLQERLGERTSVPAEAPNQSRPEPQRKRTAEEETILEKIWGPLFDSDGSPTARLGQLLRGIALHIVGDCCLFVEVSSNSMLDRGLRAENESCHWASKIATVL